LLSSIQHQGSSIIPHFFSYDGNGNVVNLVDLDTGTISAHYEYDPFGRLVCKEGTYADDNEYRFSTKRYCSQWSLYDYGYRHYSADLGRWMSRDPMGERQAANLYLFTGNSPVAFWDLLGFAWYDDPGDENRGMCKLLKIMCNDNQGKQAVKRLTQLDITVVKYTYLIFYKDKTPPLIEVKPKATTFYSETFIKPELGGDYFSTDMLIQDEDEITNEKEAARILMHESIHVAQNTSLKEEVQKDLGDVARYDETLATRVGMDKLKKINMKGNAREEEAFNSSEEWALRNPDIGSTSKAEFTTSDDKGNKTVNKKAINDYINKRYGTNWGVGRCTRIKSIDKSKWTCPQ